MKLVFMGTGQLGLPSLEKLVQHQRYEVTGIITQPDRPAGRGMKLRASPIKTFALERELPISQPENIKLTPEIIRAYNPDIVVVAAYGQILTREIIDIPPLGTINIHASLLPKYRGAAPIQWAILNGESETGISTFYIEEGLDTGDVLLERAIHISDDDTAGTLHDKLAILGAEVLLETLDGIDAQTLTATPQDHEAATYAPKITKEMAKIDWTKSAIEICNLVRGLNPMPGAYTFLDGKRLKVHFAKVLHESASANDAGLIAGINDSGIVVQTGDGHALLTEVQPEGKRVMPAAEYVRGHQINTGVKLG